MTTKKKQFNYVFFSAIGVVVMFCLLIAINLIASASKLRVDLTENNLYTLSDGTRSILNSLEAPVEIRFYVSQDNMPVTLKTYAVFVEDLLEEYEKVANGNLVVKKFNPVPDSDAEDSANLDGVEGRMLPSGERIYLGLAVSFLDSTVPIPFLSPDRESHLEYDITRAISQVMETDKPVIGVMTALPMFGQINPMAMRMGRGGQTDPWVVIEELQKDFEVREIDPTTTSIDDDVRLLMVVHPKNLGNQTQYAIDQFLLDGGSLMVFLDPLSIVDSQNTPSNNPLQGSMSSNSSLKTLTDAWGVEFDDSKVLADMTYITGINRGGAQEQSPTVLSLTADAMNPDALVTSEISNMLVPFAGSFSLQPPEGIEHQVLVHSSQDSQLVEKIMAQFSSKQVVQEFSASEKQHPLVVRLNGTFNTAFPEGKPEPSSSNTNAAPETASSNPNHLATSSSEGVVVLFSDVDFIYDQFAVQVGNILGQRIVLAQNNNLALVQNLADLLAGDKNLISMRSRATSRRPFTVFREMEKKAQQEYRSKIRDLESTLQETQTRLRELQRAQQGQSQQMILSQEQKEEIERFRRKEAQVNQELKEVRRNLRKDVDALENKLKWVNIAAMPALVTLFGLFLALIKRQRTAAK